MEHVQIKVANQVGEHVGSFDQNGFEKWQHDMQPMPCWGHLLPEWHHVGSALSPAGLLPTLEQLVGREKMR